MLRLIWKFYPVAAPTAFVYFAVRSVAPKLARFEFERLVAVLHAFSDFFSGVDGRSAHHTDQMLVKSYVAGIRVRPTWRPSLRVAAIAAVLLLGGAALLGDAGRLPVTRPPVAARPVTPAAHPRAHTVSLKSDKLSRTVSVR